MRHKFGAMATERDGHRFDSKAEGRHYDRLKLAMKAGNLIFFLRQVPFHLPGGVVFRLDYVEFWENGDIIFRDIKGHETETFKAKKRMVEALYPIRIEVTKV